MFAFLIRIRDLTSESLHGLLSPAVDAVLLLNTTPWGVAQSFVADRRCGLADRRKIKFSRVTDRSVDIGMGWLIRALRGSHAHNQDTHRHGRNRMAETPASPVLERR